LSGGSTLHLLSRRLLSMNGLLLLLSERASSTSGTGTVRDWRYETLLLHEVESSALSLGRETADSSSGICATSAGRGGCLCSLLLLLLGLLLGGDLHRTLSHGGLLSSLEIGHVRVYIPGCCCRRRLLCLVWLQSRFSILFEKKGVTRELIKPVIEPQFVRTAYAV
jgi:hypothetical protein